MPKPSHHILPTRAWCVILLPLLTSLCAAAPPAKGVEVQGGVGGGGYEYTSGGCGTTSYVNKAAEARSYAQVSYRSDIGLSATTEANINYGKVYESEPINSNTQKDPEDSGNDEGETSLLTSLALRPGFHAKYAGAELGVIMIYGNTTPSVGRFDGLEFFPSGRLWAGYPKYLYSWLDLLAGPNSEGHYGLGVGLGHASDWLRVEAGLAGRGALTLRGQLNVSPGFWLGAQTHAWLDEDNSSYGGLLTFALDLDVDAED